MFGKLRFLRSPAVVLVLTIVAINAFALSGELSAARFDLNDSVFHYTLIGRMEQAIERGENPFDSWVSEWSLGYPVPRTYQVLGHLSVALLHLALAKTVSLLTLFVWTRYLLIVFLPLTVFIAARMLTLSPREAVAAAAICPLIATNNLYGLEYGSFLWRGNGLFTQAVAMHLLLLTVGFGFRVMRGRSSAVWTGVLLGLTFLAHFIFGFIGALSLVSLAFLPNLLEMRKRLSRVVVIGGISVATVGFQLMPMLMDGALINHSRWEFQWKWDSFGASTVFSTLLRGGLFDFGRLPVLSLLALLGATVCVVRMRKSVAEKIAGDGERSSHAYRFVLLGGVLWLLLFCGRSAWGVVFTMLGAQDIQLHRLIAGVHAFGFFVIGIGLGWIWEECLKSKSRYRYALTAALTLALLAPVLRERRHFVQQNTDWSETNLAALNTEQADIQEVIGSIAHSPDRAFSGMAAGWGSQFLVGSVPFYAFFSTQHIPAVAFLYHSMALTGDLMVWFDENNPAHYRLFNVGTIIAPKSQVVAPFLSAQSSVGRFRVYQAPTNGYFDVVKVPYGVRIYPETFYDVSYAWLKSNWVLRRNHLLLDRDGRTGSDLPRLGYNPVLPEVDQVDVGYVVDQKRDGEVYGATVQVQQDGHVLFKMTFHPNWTALVDGTLQKPVMLTPGFMGVRVGPGRHSIEFRYRPGPLSAVLLIMGGLVICGGAVAERKRGFVAVDSFIDRSISTARDLVGAERRELVVAIAGLAVLCLPVCVPLMTTQLISGHDGFEYAPRLVEFHENIRHGVFLPRWAPDLSNGAGQPLFLFTPPLLYYLAEIFYALGFAATTSYNIVCILIVCASAAFMYLLGRLYYGPAGGWLSAAAYIYAPYFHVELFVRQALAEFAAFPFYPLTLYGFGRYARDQDRRFLLLGAAALSCVFLAHHAAALFFTPIVAAFVVWSAWSAKSWKLFLQLVAGCVLALALSAFVWLPAMAEMSHTHVDRLLEGYLNYSNHLVYLHQFLSTFWGFGLSVAGPGDGMSFSLGWSHLVLLILALVLARKSSSPTKGMIKTFAWIAAVYCAVMTPAALWVWENIRTLQLIEFPWRMLGSVSVCVAVVVGSLAFASEKVQRGAGFVVALALLIAPNLSHVGVERYYRLNGADWTPDQIARRNVSVTTREEYEPRTVLQRPAYQTEKIHSVFGDAKVSLLVMHPASWSAQIKASTPSVLRANLLYFPGWTATVDDASVETQLEPQTGEIQIAVPAGEHRLKIELRRTNARLYGEALSLAALFVLITILFSDPLTRRE